MPGERPVMEGSDFVKLYMKEGCLSWEAAGNKKNKMSSHVFFNEKKKKKPLCTGTMLDTRTVSQLGSQLGLYIRIIQGGLKKKNAWTTPSEILMKLFGRGT